MKLIISIIIFLLGTQVVFSKVDKITICHATSSEVVVTLELPEESVYGESGHFYENGTTQAGHEEDYLGECVVPTESPVPSESPEPSTEPSESPEPSETPLPSESPEPTLEPTPLPSESPEPSETPSPTESPEPSNSPELSNTPVPPPSESPSNTPPVGCQSGCGGGGFYPLTTPTPTPSPTPSPLPTETPLVLGDMKELPKTGGDLFNPIYLILINLGLLLITKGYEARQF